MNRPPFRTLFTALALTLLVAGELSARAATDSAGRRAPVAASPTVIGIGVMAAASADVPGSEPALVPDAPAAAARLAEGEGERNGKRGEAAGEGGRGGAGDARDDGDQDEDKDDGKDDEDKPEGGDDEAAGTTIERLRAFYPEKIGEFRRTAFRAYDRAGDDASVGYNLFREGEPGVPWVAFTTYFFPTRGDSLEEDVEIAIRDVTSQHEEAEVGEAEDVEVTRHGKRHKGRRVRFKFTDTFGGKEQPLASELYLFPGAPGRLVKYRITFPAADAGALQKKVDEFAKSFPWPRGL